MQRPKYNAKKTEVDGILFDSMIESKFYTYFQELGITVLELQPKFLLQEGFRDKRKGVLKNGQGVMVKAINYIADFAVLINEKVWIIDIKGMKTPDFKLKEKMLLWKYPDLNFTTIKSKKEFNEKFGS
jgi:Protein of unknown function (DUF1064)